MPSPYNPEHANLGECLGDLIREQQKHNSYTWRRIVANRDGIAAGKWRVVLYGSRNRMHNVRCMVHDIRSFKDSIWPLNIMFQRLNHCTQWLPIDMNHDWIFVFNPRRANSIDGNHLSITEHSYAFIENHTLATLTHCRTAAAPKYHVYDHPLHKT